MGGERFWPWVSLILALRPKAEWPTKKLKMWTKIRLQTGKTEGEGEEGEGGSGRGGVEEGRGDKMIYVTNNRALVTYIIFQLYKEELSKH